MSGKDLPILSLLLAGVALQLLDGVFTYVGVSHGIPEGNPLVNWQIHVLGLGAGILLAKGISIICVGLVAYADNWKGLLIINCITAFAVASWVFQ